MLSKLTIKRIESENMDGYHDACGKFIAVKSCSSKQKHKKKTETKIKQVIQCGFNLVFVKPNTSFFIPFFYYSLVFASLKYNHE